MKDESKPLSYWLNLTIYSSDGDGQYKVIRSTFDNGLIDPHNFIVILEDNERNVFWQTKKMPISNIDLLMGYLQGPSKFYQKAMESRLRRKYLEV
jgi:hypothetical protein